MRNDLPVTGLVFFPVVCPIRLDQTKDEQSRSYASPKPNSAKLNLTTPSKLIKLKPIKLKIIFLSVIYIFLIRVVIDSDRLFHSDSGCSPKLIDIILCIFKRIKQIILNVESEVKVCNVCTVKTGSCC